MSVLPFCSIPIAQPGVAEPSQAWNNASIPALKCSDCRALAGAGDNALANKAEPYRMATAH
jgi:hypothetical protein